MGGGLRLQLTSTSEEDRSLRQRPPSLWSRLDRPLVPGIIAFLGWLGFALARWQIWAKGHLSLFIMAGHTYTHRAQLPHGLLLVPSAGYDGQFYYRLALDPANWHATAFGITMDQSYRFTRIGYPVLAWILSLGQHQLVPVVLVVLNLLAVAAMAMLGAVFARQAGRHALWGLAFAAYFGLVISVGRDTAEPLAEACLLGGLLAYRRGIASRGGQGERGAGAPRARGLPGGSGGMESPRESVPSSPRASTVMYLMAAALFSYGAITRETILFAPAAIAITRLIAIIRRRAHPGLADLTWVLPAAAYGAIELAVHFVVKGKVPVLASSGRNLTAPFTGLAHALRYNAAHLSTAHLSPIDIAMLEYATLAIFILAGFAVLMITTAPGHERLAFVLFVLQLGLLSGQIWNSTFGEGRPLIEPYLMALVLLVSTRRRDLSWPYLLAIVACVLPALAVVARRRILYM
jgi:hypothetical protein